MARRDAVGMTRQRSDGAVWIKKPGGDWQQLLDGKGPSGQSASVPGGEAGATPAAPERADAQWAAVVQRHGLDGHVPEASVHPQHVDTDLEGDTDTKPVLSWTDSTGAPRHSYTRAFHQTRAAQEQHDVAMARSAIVAAHSGLARELKGGDAPHAALALAHLHTGHDLADLANGEVYHNRGETSGVSIARSKHLEIKRSHTADENHPDKIHVALRHRRGHVVLAPIHDPELAAHHAAGGGHGTVERAKGLLTEYGVDEVHQHHVRAHAFYHHATDHLAKLPAVDFTDPKAGTQQVLTNVQAVSDHLADQYGHPPAPAGMSYVPPAVIAAYVEDAGGAKHWPKAFQALHTEAPEQAGVLPVKRSKRAPTNEAEAKIAVRYRESDAQRFVSCVQIINTDGKPNWPGVVRLFRSKSALPTTTYTKTEAPWSSTSVAAPSSSDPSATASTPDPSASSSTPPTEVPRPATPTHSPTPSSPSNAPAPAPRAARGPKALHVAWLHQPADGRLVGVARSELQQLVKDAHTFSTLLTPGSKIELANGREYEIARRENDRVFLVDATATHGAAWRVSPAGYSIEKLRRVICRSWGFEPGKMENIEHTIAHAAPKPPDPRSEMLASKARNLYIKCMRAHRAGKLGNEVLIKATDLVMHGKHGEAVDYLLSTLGSLQVQRSAEGAPPGAPSTTNRSTSGTSKRRVYQPGETSTWSDGSRHVKEGPGKWRDEKTTAKKKKDGGEKGGSISLEGARARLKKLRAQRRHTQSKDALTNIDKQITQLKTRIAHLEKNEPHKPRGGSATQTAGQRTERSMYRELQALAARAQDTSSPLAETYEKLNDFMVRVRRSATAAFDVYCAGRPGYEAGVTYLASATCPTDLADAARAYAAQKGHPALRHALITGEI